MFLERCSDQKRQTLDEFYAELLQADRSVDRDVGAAMLDLIARLQQLPDSRRAWGLTSHYHLCLLQRPDVPAASRAPSAIP